MQKSIRKVLIIVPILVETILAGPKIEFDTKDYNCGTVIEGKTNTLLAIFNVKNTGDSLLKIGKVRPGCGCTVVKYDSLVLPGKSTKIESKVNIAGSRIGLLSKSITVQSNAENEPSVKLIIDATVLPIIDVSERHVSLDSSNQSVPKLITLATQKNDLLVKSISFNYGDHSGARDSKPPKAISIRHIFSSIDSTNADGYRVYTLQLFSPEPDEFITGEFIITTNHPDKTMITLRGNISN